jgi:hypothetical protein
LANYKVLGKHNLYQLPQKEKSTMRNIQDVLSDPKSAIKTLTEKLTSFREDEAELGQNEEGDINTGRSYGSLSIPKYGLRKLKENPVTDDLLESYTWMNFKSNQFKARVENIGDALAIKESLMDASFSKNIQVETSNVYKTFKENMDYNFFGVKEVNSTEFKAFGRTMDSGAILRTFAQAIRVRNLAFSAIIPITSATTGSISKLVGFLAGDVTNVAAQRESNKFFKKHAKDSMGEILSLESKSLLNSMGEYYGWFDPIERYNDTLNKNIRALGKAPMSMHQMANFPINTRVGLSILADHKFVGEELLSFREFTELHKDKSKKEKLRLWEEYTSLLSIIEVDENGKMIYDYSCLHFTVFSNYDK